MSSKRYDSLNTPHTRPSQWSYPPTPGSTPCTNTKTVPPPSSATGSQSPRPILKHRSVHSCDDCQSPPASFPVEGVRTIVQFAEGSSSPPVITASPKIVPWPVDHPPWLPLRKNAGSQTSPVVPQQTSLPGSPRLRPAADHPPTPFNRDQRMDLFEEESDSSSSMYMDPEVPPAQGHAPATPQGRERSRTPPTPAPQRPMDNSQPPMTPVYRSSHLQPPIYDIIPSPASPPGDLPRGREALNERKSAPPPRSPNLRSPGASPLSRSAPMSPLSNELQQRLSGLLERPSSAPPEVRVNASGHPTPSSRKSRPYAYASSPAKALGLGLFPCESPAPAPPLSSVPVGSGSPPRKLSPISFDREHASSYPEFTFPPQDSTPASSPAGRSDSRLPSPKDKSGVHTPFAPAFPEFTFSRHTTPARSPRDLPDTQLPLQAGPYRGPYIHSTPPKAYLDIASDHATQCCFTLPIPVEGNRGAPTGALQCTVQGEAKIRLIVC